MRHSFFCTVCTRPQKESQLQIQCLRGFFGCTVLVGMICEIYVQILIWLMMKLSYVSQLEGCSLRDKTQGRQQKP